LDTSSHVRKRAVNRDVRLGEGPEPQSLGLDHVCGSGWIEADQTHCRRVQCDRITAGEEDIEVDRVTVDGSAPRHADESIHERQGYGPKLVDVGDQFVKVLVEENAIVTRNTAPLVLQSSGENGRGMGFQDWERYENISLKPRAGHAKSFEARVRHFHELAIGQ